MADLDLFHGGAREWQDRFATRALADRLVERLARDALTAEDVAFIATRTFLFLATADDRGAPDVSYKGGAPGFVRVVDERTLAFPSYDGNGMFLSLGNLHVNPQVGLLFVDFEQPRRLRVRGRASVRADDPLAREFTGAQLVVRVHVEAIFPNCPRYVHRMAVVETSPYVPCAGSAAPVPAWKLRPEFREVLPPGDPAAADDTPRDAPR